MRHVSMPKPFKVWSKSMLQHGTPCQVYAPMYNGRTERMMGTIKNAIWQIVIERHREWDEAVNSAVFGHRFCPAPNKRSPFELLYVVKSWIALADLMEITRNTADGDRWTELLALLGPGLARVDEQKKYAGKKRWRKICCRRSSGGPFWRGLANSKVSSIQAWATRHLPCCWGEAPKVWLNAYYGTLIENGYSRMQASPKLLSWSFSSITRGIKSQWLWLRIDFGASSSL